MKIADMKVTELINAVGSDAPAPGGGGSGGRHRRRADHDGQRPHTLQKGL